MNAVPLTVVLCTFERQELLRSALESLVQQTADPAEFDVLVVDNGPDEATRRVVSGFEGSGLSLAYLPEPARGLNRARSTGWRRASGEFVAYVDDDAEAAPEWAAALINVIGSAADSVACLGGPIVPIRKDSPSAGSLELAAGTLDLGAEVRPLRDDENVWGVNMAFRRSVLAALDAFSEPLGRQGKRMLANEDILIQRQIDRLGLTRLYVPHALVHHHQHLDRLTPQVRRQRAYWQGVSDAVMDRVLDDPTPGDRLRSGARRLRRAVVSAAPLIRGSARRDEGATLVRQRDTMAHLGYARGLVRPWRLDGPRRDG